MNIVLQKKRHENEFYSIYLQTHKLTGQLHNLATK